MMKDLIKTYVSEHNFSSASSVYLFNTPQGILELTPNDSVPMPFIIDCICEIYHADSAYELTNSEKGDLVVSHSRGDQTKATYQVDNTTFTLKSEAKTSLFTGLPLDEGTKKDVQFWVDKFGRWL